MATHLIRTVRLQHCRYAARPSKSSFPGHLKRYASSSVVHKPLPGKIHPETIAAVSYGKKTATTPPLKKPIDNIPKSTPATEKKTIASSSASIPTQSGNTKVNPPESTLPPQLDVPVRKPGQATIKYYYSIGKSYLTFYKTALKAIWYNSRSADQIEKRLPSKMTQDRKTTLVLALQSGLLTRADYQFLLRSRRDFLKLPLMGLVLTIFGEFTPLVIVFLTGVVPRPAWIPKQVERVRTKIEQRREESFRSGTLHGDESLKTLGLSQGIDGMSPSQILHVSRTLNLHSTLWETLWDRPPQWLAKSRVKNQLEYLDADDKALHRDGGARDLSDEEVKMACEERGIDVLKGNMKSHRSNLDAYMKWRIKKQVNVASMMLVRPPQYDQLGVTQV